jgi:flagellar hook assembly protein FlgD
VEVLSPATTSVPATPRVTQLAQPRPNPFAQVATISFSLSTAGPVELTVYSVDGRRIRTLASGVREAGEYTELWDGRDDSGSAASPGVYYLHLSAGSNRFTRTMVHLK